VAAAGLDVEALYRTYGHSVLRRARQILGNEDDAAEVLQELFGISPEISCVVRESRAGDDGTHVEPVEEDDAPGDDAEALRRVQEMLGAKPVTDEKA